MAKPCSTSQGYLRRLPAILSPSRVPSFLCAGVAIFDGSFVWWPNGNLSGSSGIQFLLHRVMSRISPTRAAMWFLNWQILWLAATISFFWTEPNAIIAASGLCAGTILSRVGLWGYDLSAQVIIQIVSTFCLRVCDINSSPTSRRYRKTLEDPFRQRRPHFRMHSSFYPMLSPSRCLARTSSSIPPS